MPTILTSLVHDVRQVGVAIIVVLLAVIVSQLLKQLIRRRQKTQHLPVVMARRLQGLRQWLILIVTAVILLKTFGVFSSAWAVLSAGLAAVAVGFVAAWSVLSNLTAALLILTFRPFRMGDYVDLVDGNPSNPLGGRVVDINLMFVTLRVGTPGPGKELQYLRVPNNLFFQKMIRTYSTEGPVNSAPFFSAESPERPPTS